MRYYRTDIYRTDIYRTNIDARIARKPKAEHAYLTQDAQGDPRHESHGRDVVPRGGAARTGIMNAQSNAIYLSILGGER